MKNSTFFRKRLKNYLIKFSAHHVFVEFFYFFYRFKNRQVEEHIKQALQAHHVAPGLIQIISIKINSIRLTVVKIEKRLRNGFCLSQNIISNLGLLEILFLKTGFLAQTQSNLI